MAKRHLQLILLCLLLGCSSLLYAREQRMKGMTNDGYSFTVHMLSDTLYAYPGSKPIPGTTAAWNNPASESVTVHVTDQAGNPVNRVQVAFEVAPTSQLSGMVAISEPKAFTSDGVAQVTIMATPSATSGEGHLMVQVGDKTVKVPLYVQPAPGLPN